MCAPPTSEDAVLSPGFDDAFTDSLAQFVQKLWSFKGLPATTVADAGGKGLRPNLQPLDYMLRNLNW